MILLKIEHYLSYSCPIHLICVLGSSISIRGWFVLVSTICITLHGRLLSPIKSNTVKNTMKLCFKFSYFLKQLTLKDTSTYGNTKYALLTSKKLYSYKERHLKARSSHPIHLDSGINKMCQFTSSTWRFGPFSRQLKDLRIFSGSRSRWLVL